MREGKHRSADRVHQGRRQPQLVVSHFFVISAILGTREGAAEGGYRSLSSGVIYSDQLEAAALRDALASRKG